MSAEIKGLTPQALEHIDQIRSQPGIDRVVAIFTKNGPIIAGIKENGKKATISYQTPSGSIALLGEDFKVKTSKTS